MTSQDENVNRRDLASVLGLAVGAFALTKCAPNDGPLAAASQAVATANDIGIADTVLGAAPPNARTGDLATKTSTTLVPGITLTLVCALGCVSRGDGGGGVFFWSSATITDDGGTFVVPAPTDGGAPGVGAQGPGWVRLYSGPLNVKWFGADGAGSAPSDVAISVALTMMRPGDTLFFPKGTYVLNTGIGIGTPPSLPSGITLAGDGWNTSSGSILEFNNTTGDGIYICNQPTTNSSVFVSIQDLAIRLAATNALGAAISAIGGGNARICRCAFLGSWHYGIAWDGMEEGDIMDCYFAHSDGAGLGSVGIWFANATRGMSVAATNVNHIQRCYFNAPDIGIWAQGGASNTVRDCLVNLHVGSAFAKIGSALNWSFDSNYSEGSGTGASHFKFSNLPLSGGTAAQLIAIRNHLASGDAPFLDLSDGTCAAYNLRIEDNLLACDWIVGSNMITAVHISTNNYLSSGHLTTRGRLYDTQPAMTGGLVSNFGVGNSNHFGTGGDPSANHQWQIRDYSIPVHRDSAGVYNFREFWVDSSLAKTTWNRRERSALTGNTDAGRWDAQESGYTVQNGSAVRLASVVVPQRCAGDVVIEVRAMASANEANHGIWRIRRRVYRANGGNVQLLGTASTELVITDSGWTAPVIAIDTTAQTVFASVQPRSDGSGYYSVRTTIEVTQP